MKVASEPLHVEDIIQMDKKKVLQIDSEYQRGAEWNVKQERLLIDSMLRGYPIPLFFFHVKRTEGKWGQNTYFFIVDGQQRVNAICNFVNNRFQLFDPEKDKKTGLPRFLLTQKCPWAGKSFDSLPDDLRKAFMSLPLQVMMIETNDENEIRDLFVRLQAGLPLSAQEKRDAWPGEFTEFIKDIAGKVSREPRQSRAGHDFFNKLLRGSAGRGNMRKTCAQMFILLYSRRYNRYKPDSFSSLNGQDIDNFYRQHLDFNPRLEDSCAPRFREILDEACRILGHDKKPKKFEVHIAFNIVLMFDLLLGNFAQEWKDYFPKALDKFLENLAIARRNKKDEYWLRYGQYTGVSASSKGTVEKRYRFFESKMLELMPPLKPLDPKRGYSLVEKEFIYYTQKKNCNICGESVEWYEAEIHHEVPHAAGGPTTLENAKLVHKQCNPRGPQSGLYVATEEDQRPSEKYWENEEESNGTKIIPGGRRVRLAHLYKAGLLQDRCQIVYPRRNDSIVAEFQAPKTIVYKEDGKIQRYTSFNNLLHDLLGTSQNIFLKTIIRYPDGREVRLGDLRSEFIQLMSEGAVELNEPDEDSGDIEAEIDDEEEE